MYVGRKKVQENRVAEALKAAGWKEFFHPELMPPPGFFKREHMIDFVCAEPAAYTSKERGKQATRPRGKALRDAPPSDFCRIDFVLGYEGGYVFLETDEHQHRFGFNHGDSATVSCDGRRMANVHSSLTMKATAAGTDAPSIFWLR